MKEELETTKEIAKTTGIIVSFFSEIFGDLGKEIVGIFHDKVKYYRHKNLLRLADKVDKIHRDRKVKGKANIIPPRFAISLIEQASREDNETIQDMWAGLIANATDPEKRLNMRKQYIEIISSLEPLDAKLMEWLYNKKWKVYREVRGGGVNEEDLEDEFGVDISEIRLSLQNLARLGCIQSEKDISMDSKIRSGIQLGNQNVTFIFTHLGANLVEACKV
jgi:hypothetical protein